MWRKINLLATASSPRPSCTSQILILSGSPRHLRSLHRLQVCREVPQERRLEREVHPPNLLAALPHREDHLDHVIYVALRVNATRNRQSYQVHRGCRPKHQRANLDGADAAFQIPVSYTHLRAHETVL